MRVLSDEDIDFVVEESLKKEWTDPGVSARRNMIDVYEDSPLSPGVFDRNPGHDAATWPEPRFMHNLDGLWFRD